MSVDSALGRIGILDKMSINRLIYTPGRRCQAGCSQTCRVSDGHNKVALITLCNVLYNALLQTLQRPRTQHRDHANHHITLPKACDALMAGREQQGSASVGVRLYAACLSGPATCGFTVHAASRLAACTVNS
jgi:hypothetical protein